MPREYRHIQEYESEIRNPKIIQRIKKTAAMRNQSGGKKIVVCVNSLS